MTETTGTAPGPPAATRGKGPLGTLRMMLELVKFEHSIFALPYAYVGAVYGAAAVREGWPAGSATTAVFVNSAWVSDSGWPAGPVLIAITIVMVCARAIAFIVNRAADKEIDARNPRTAGRAVPQGIVKAWELWLFALGLLILYGAALLPLHPIVIPLAPVPLVAFLIYPYTKRFTPLCHHWLGLCLGLAPVGGWVAVSGNLFDWRPWAIGAAVMVWTAGFDIIYATQDVESDRLEGIHSMPADFGVGPALVQTRALHVLAIALLVAVGWGLSAGWPYFGAIAIAAALLAYENSLVSKDDLSRVNAAFFTVNGIIAIVVLAGALLDRVLA